MLADDLNLVASILRDGSASAYHQQLACSQLQRIAVSVRRMEAALDDLVGHAAAEERRKQFRVVRG
jgi:hypothetical protein